MKKTILILLFPVLISCSSDKREITNKEQQGLNQETPISLLANETFDQNIESNTTGRREYIDSANFHIIKGWYVSGAKFIEVFENRDNRIDSWVEYYENGNLKKKGLMTTSNHHYVGKWEYYSNSGELDSIVNYDIKQPISYFKALSIAKANGFKMPDMEVSKSYGENKMYWEVNRWTKIKGGGGQTAETILIDSESGKVHKPKTFTIGIY